MKYNTVLFKDQNNQFYIGDVKRKKIIGFKAINNLEVALNTNEYLIVEVTEKKDNLQLVPLTTATISVDDNIVNLYTLEHDALLKIMNKSLKGGTSCSVESGDKK